MPETGDGTQGLSKKPATVRRGGVARSVMKLWRMRQDMCTLRAAFLTPHTAFPHLTFNVLRLNRQRHIICQRGVVAVVIVDQVDG